MDKHKYSERRVISFIVADSRVKSYTESFGTFLFLPPRVFLQSVPPHLLQKLPMLVS